MRNPKIGVIHWHPAKNVVTWYCAYISKTTKPIKMKFQDNIGTMKMYSLTQYYDVTTNSIWRTSAILKIVISPYIGEKSFDFDKIWCTLGGHTRLRMRRQPHDQKWKVLNSRWRTSPILKIGFLVITQQLIIRFHWNSARGSSIAWYWRHDINCKFKKFKMADGRHLKKSLKRHIFVKKSPDF